MTGGGHMVTEEERILKLLHKRTRRIYLIRILLKRGVKPAMVAKLTGCEEHYVNTVINNMLR